MCYTTCKSHALVSPLSIIVGARSATRIIAELDSIPKEDLTVVIAQQPNQSHQLESIQPDADNQDKEKDDKSRRRPPIGQLLRDLRGTKTLRQVEADTGITNAYLSNIELGLKKPGIKTLAKLGIYYQVPLDHLLNVAGLQDQTPEPAQQESVFDLRRAYAFVLGDPNVSSYQKPADTPPLDMQKFVVEMYQHFTGRKLL